MIIRNKVFISYKHHGPSGEILHDYTMAKDVYLALKDVGIEAFFSDQTITASGQSDYKKLIDDMLDEASLLIVVSTNAAHCTSNWVRYEWDSFYNDLLSEKKQGCLVSYLNTTNINDFPRTIRSNQFFNEKDNGLPSLVTFVKNYFKHTETPDFKQKGSCYGYAIGDEKRRLVIQARVESLQDYGYIEKLLPPKDGVYNVLDVGCSMGDVTFGVFSKFGDRVRVLGVDKYQICIDTFLAKCPQNMAAEILNFEDDDYPAKLQKHMNKHNIDKFDLVYCSLSLHHMSDSGGVIKKLKSFMRVGGYIYIRTCDDALKLAYPDPENVVREVIETTANVASVSDRYHGRKVFHQLQKAKYDAIRIESFLIDTTGKDVKERTALFSTAFAWRKNYFVHQLNSSEGKGDEAIQRAMAAYNAIMAKLDKIDEMFYNLAFYFGYYVTIAIGRKDEEFSL